MNNKYYLECVIAILVVSCCFAYYEDEDDDDGPLKENIRRGGYLPVPPYLLEDEADDFTQEFAFNRCPWIRNKLKNGRVKIRNRGRIAKFLCDPGYELAGKRFSTCVRGQWNNPIPVCVARGCFRPPEVPNSRITEAYRGAILMYDCHPGYTLEGPAALYCDGRTWTSDVPTCEVAITNASLSCDFEDPDLCGWSQDPTHDFDWKRNQFSTPSGHAGTGPSYDHTFGSGKGGFYLYQEVSSPRKPNDISRLFSPVYSEHKSGGCFLFWYHMYGSTIGGLKVYVKPQSHVFGEMSATWELYGDQGDMWRRANISIPRFAENFQIVIEGIRGSNYIGDTAIDDVYLSTTPCDEIGNSTDHISYTASNSCRGRCREAEISSYCGCNDDCHANGSCCFDFMKICTGNYDTPENENPSEEQATTLTSSTITTTGSGENVVPEIIVTTSSSLSTESDSTSSSSVSSPFNSTSGITTSITTPVPKEHELITATSYYATTTQSTTKMTQPATITTTTMSSSSAPSTTTTPTSTTAIPTTTTTTPEPTTTTSTPTQTAQNITTIALTTTITSMAPITQKASTIPTINSTFPSTSKTILITLPATRTSTAESLTNASQSASATIINLQSSTLPTSTVYINTKPPFETPSTTAAPPKESSALPTTITLLPSTSTRKTYNLRPRNRTDLPTTTSTSRSVVWPVTATRQTTSISIQPSRRTTWSYRTTTSTTKQPSKRTTWSYRTTTRPTTFRSKPSTRLSTSTVSISTEFSVESVNEQASKTESAAMSSTQPTIIIILVVGIVVCFVAGAAYVMRKRTQKRQSKLSDDSEMRFLSESDSVEYSDPAALEKMLIR
ncbi:uncharacterized protein [Parasteatoda tepidariorum]|uniref:uncharacterized protein isoform X1 n=1 Tax=Parasteatoda tepidariorum TaxID=114398 RepID=UPI001C71ACD6|nr:serine-rich adhesin for platelets isoform X1 [Parasteatoda tepidariorum]